MRFNRFLLIIVVILLLSGWILFQVLQPGEGYMLGEPGFKAWFWQERSLDLVVQVALIFAGALGIAAILPGEEQDD